MKKFLIIAFAMIAMPMISSAQLVPTTALRPVITITTSPSAVVPGDTSIVTWSAVNASSCKFDSAITRFGFPTGNAAVTGSQVVAPTTATGPVYGTVTCNNNGLATSTASIRVSLLPSITITASPKAVVPGGSSVVSWTAKNKAFCTFYSDTYSGFPAGNVPATGSAVVTLTTGPAYGTITCRDIYGSNPVRTTIRIGLLPPPAPVITVSVVATSTVLLGESTEISWSSTNATACTFESETYDLTRFGFPVGAVSTSGSQIVTLTSATGPLNGTITCFNNLGSKPLPAPIRVGLSVPSAPAITVSVVASSTVLLGESTVISWSSTNATACTFDTELLDLTRFGFPAGYAPLSGSQVVTPTLLTGSVNGILTCYNTLGSAPVRVPVRVGLITPLVPISW